MAYCDDEDIRRFLRQSNQFLRDEEVDFSGQIADAEADVNADLKAMGYDVPFSTGSVPELVKQLTVFRTCQFLCIRNSIENMADRFEKLADKKVARLERGISETPEEDMTDETAEAGRVVSAGGTERAFTREKMEKW